MSRRIAAALSLVAFAFCLVMGIQAGNGFATVLSRALAAMAVTFVVALIVGAMGQKMIEENLNAARKINFPEAKSGKEDR